MLFVGRFSLLTVAAAFLLSASPLPSANAQNAVSRNASIPSMDTNQLNVLMKGKEPFVLLDVRQPKEFNQGHIANAVLMPLNTVPDHLREIPKDKKVVVYCRSGRRSAQAAAFLRAQGYTNVINLSGGYIAWSDALKHAPGEKKACPTAAAC